MNRIYRIKNVGALLAARTAPLFIPSILLYQETPQSTQSVRAEIVEAHRPFDKLRASGKMEVVTVRSIILSKKAAR